MYVDDCTLKRRLIPIRQQQKKQVAGQKSSMRGPEGSKNKRLAICFCLCFRIVCNGGP